MIMAVFRIRIRIQGLSGSVSGLRFLAGSGFDEYGSETLATIIQKHSAFVNNHTQTSSKGSLLLYCTQTLSICFNHKQSFSIIIIIHNQSAFFKVIQKTVENTPHVFIIIHKHEHKRETRFVPFILKSILQLLKFRGQTNN